MQTQSRSSHLAVPAGQIPSVVPPPQVQILNAPLVLINLQAMNDFERYHRCSPLGSLQHYPWTDRSMSMAVSHAVRSDMRSCPTRQTRNVPPPDPDPESNNGQPRRRIAVAVSYAWSLVWPSRLLVDHLNDRWQTHRPAHLRIRG